MKKLLLLTLACIPAFAARPTISSIAVTGTTHTSTRISYNVSTPGTCQVIWGTSSGTYPFTGTSFYSSDPQYGSGVHVCSIIIGGLTPNTTYYFLPTARLAITSTTAADNCNAAGLGCGAAEQPVLTDPQPAIHPAPPAAPVTTKPTAPDTTGYTVVPMGPDGSGNCAATSNVTAPGSGHWSGNVTTGMSLRTVLATIWYKTVLRFPQGSSCYIQDIGNYGHSGAILPHYSPDGGASDWVVIETQQLSPSDFPVYGSRIGPEYAGKLATISAYTPALPQFTTPPPPGAYYSVYNGQIFECDSCGANHFWFRNLHLSHRADSTLYPATTVDPPAFAPYIRLTPPCAYSMTTACDPTDATSPHDIVMDRLYAPKGPHPSREIGCFYPGGNNWTIIGSYCTTEFWLPAVYPSRDPITSGAVFQVPYGYYQLNQFDNNPIGMKSAAGYSGTAAKTIPATPGVVSFQTQAHLNWSVGDRIDLQAAKSDYSVTWVEAQYGMMGTVTAYNSSTGDISVNITDPWYTPVDYSYWRLEQPAKVTFSGANIGTYTGQVWGWVDSTGVTFDFETATGVTATCVPTTYCHILSATPGTINRYTVPVDGQYWFTGNFDGAGNFNMTWATAHGAFGTPSQYLPWRPQPVYIYAGQHGIFDNNYIEGLGMTIYNDPQGLTTDISFTHNLVYAPRTQMKNSGIWNGYQYRWRNIFESKEMNRALIDGNIIDGSGANENLGTVFYQAGTYGGNWAKGVTDIAITNNLVRHISQGFHCGGSGTTPPDPVPPMRFSILNNMFIDLDKDRYSNLGVFPSYGSGAFATYAVCSDIEMRNNTVGLTHGNGPSLISVGSSAGDGGYVYNTLFADGFKYRQNLVFMSYDANITPIRSFGVGQNAVPNYPTNPYNLANDNTGSTSWSSYLNSFFMHNAAGQVPDWDIGNNIFVGAQSGSGFSWSDISQATVTSIKGLWPETTSKFVSGANMQARTSAAGLSASMDLTSGNPLLYKSIATPDNSGYIGANVEDIISHTGIVTNIKTLQGVDYLGFSYIAPDSRACTVIASSDGTTWAGPFNDGGGPRARTLVASGLTANTSYQYRLLCYFDQSATYEFTSDQITSGTLSTLTNSSGTLLTGFTLPAGAAQVLVTMTPLSGSVVVNTCTTSPCSLTVPNGTYNRVVQPQTGGAVNVGESLTSLISVLDGTVTATTFTNASGMFTAAPGLFTSH